MILKESTQLVLITGIYKLRAESKSIGELEIKAAVAHPH